ncbi:MAG: M48 family metallopeptidase [Verrucomicrobiota bacterium]
MNLFLMVALALILARATMQFWLEQLNRRHVRAHSDRVPEPFRDMIDEPAYRKSIDYTLAKSKFHQTELGFDTAVLIAILFTGILPWFYNWFQHQAGISVWAEAAFLFAVGILLSLPGLPFSWYAQFRLEERFGFNTTTQKIWWLDRVKGFLLALLLGYPLLVFILKLVQWTVDLWWLFAFAAVLAFQLLMLVLAPIFILPLFNKFTPLPEGSLRERLLALGKKTGFHAKTIQVMDGSKRSRHSNAFFTGFKRFRKIVLFDTLIQQLTESELEAVLAHEIGHYKKKHIPKMLAWSAVMLFLTFYLVSLLAQQNWFYEAFGFQTKDIVIALLLFSLLSGVVTFWFSPLAHGWSRKHEYEADRYAAETMTEIQSITRALRKLNEKNLSNLTPHPVYSGFYYSHPTLLERESALQKIEKQRRALAASV